MGSAMPAPRLAQRCRLRGRREAVLRPAPMSQRRPSRRVATVARAGRRFQIRQTLQAPRDRTAWSTRGLAVGPPSPRCRCGRRVWKTGESGEPGIRPRQSQLDRRVFQEFTIFQVSTSIDTLDPPAVVAESRPHSGHRAVVEHGPPKRGSTAWGHRDPRLSESRAEPRPQSCRADGRRSARSVVVLATCDGRGQLNEEVGVDWEIRTRGRFRGGAGARWDAAERNVCLGLAEYGLRDVFRDLHGYRREAYSWVLERGGNEVRRRFDHVFASAALQTVACEYPWSRVNPD